MKSLIAVLTVMNFAIAYAADSLVKTDTVVGKGKEAVAGKTVEVNYTGWLYEPKAPKQRGKQFDSSIGRGPFSFPLGAGRVIRGWDCGTTASWYSQETGPITTHIWPITSGHVFR